MVKRTNIARNVIYKHVHMFLKLNIKIEIKKYNFLNSTYFGKLNRKIKIDNIRIIYIHM